MKRLLILGPIIALALVMASVPMSRAVAEQTCFDGQSCVMAQLTPGNAETCTGVSVSLPGCTGNNPGYMCKKQYETTPVTDYAHYEKYLVLGVWKWNYSKHTEICNSINDYQYTYLQCNGDQGTCPTE